MGSLVRTGNREGKQDALTNSNYKWKLNIDKSPKNKKKKPIGINVNLEPKLLNLEVQI